MISLEAKRTTLITLGAMVSLTLASCGANTVKKAGSEDAAIVKEESADDEAGDTQEVSNRLPVHTGRRLDVASYQFFLRAPDSRWQVLDEKEVEIVTPDASAGVTSPAGIFGAVIVERSKDTPIEDMADLILEGMPLERKEIKKREQVSFREIRSIYFEIEGSIRDIAVHYRGYIFNRQGYTFQLIAFAPLANAEHADLQSVFDSFRLLDGEIRGATDAGPSADTVGVGWRLERGRYESVTANLRADPPEGWRTVVGAQAQRINANAAVVFVSQEPEAYMVIIPEIVGSINLDEYRADRLQLTRSSLEGSIEEYKEGVIFNGEKTTCVALRSDDSAWQFHAALTYKDGVVYQGVGWFHKSYGDEGAKAVHSMMAAIQPLPKADRIALKKELEASSLELSFVGADHSYRARVYENYSLKVQWQVPKGFWDVSTGQNARQANPAAQLYARLDNSAVHAMIIAERANLNNDKLHEIAVGNVRKNLSLSAVKGPKKERIGSGAALQSEGDTKVGGIDLRYRIITATQGEHLVQLHLWGPSHTFKANRDLLKQAARNLRIIPQLQASERSKGVYIDHRMGYSVKEPKGYRYAPRTPDFVQGIASFAVWEKSNNDWLSVMAIGMFEEGQDREGGLKLLETHVTTGFAGLLRGVVPTRKEVELLGRPARHLHWDSSSPFDAFLLLKGHTLYAIMVMGQSNADESKKLAAQHVDIL